MNENIRKLKKLQQAFEDVANIECFNDCLDVNSYPFHICMIELSHDLRNFVDRSIERLQEADEPAIVQEIKRFSGNVYIDSHVGLVKVDDSDLLFMLDHHPDPSSLLFTTDGEILILNWSR